MKLQLFTNISWSPRFPTGMTGGWNYWLTFIKGARLSPYFEFFPTYWQNWASICFTWIPQLLQHFNCLLLLQWQIKVLKQISDNITVCSYFSYKMKPKIPRTCFCSIGHFRDFAALERLHPTDVATTGNFPLFQYEPSSIGLLSPWRAGDSSCLLTYGKHRPVSAPRPIKPGQPSSPG